MSCPSLQVAWAGRVELEVHSGGNARGRPLGKEPGSAHKAEHGVPTWRNPVPWHVPRSGREMST